MNDGLADELKQVLSSEDRMVEVLRAWVARAWQISEDKGWHEEQDEVKALGILHETPFLKRLLVTHGSNVSEKLALIHSEVSEALELLREKGFDPQDRPKGIDGKPLGFGSELADIVIRVFDLAGILKIDLADEIREKMIYNAKRSFRHGGKNA